MTADWHSLHVFIGARAHADTLVLLADRIIRSCAPDPSDWFFIRYGEAGPHLRVRLGPGTHAAGDALCDALRAEATRLAHDSPDPEWTGRAGYRDNQGRLFGPGEVVSIAYEPEVKRYGGTVALGVSETLFRHSSAIAVRAIALTPAFANRPALALDLMLAAAAASMPANGDASAFFADYAHGWTRLLAAPDDPIAIDAGAAARLRDRLAAHRTAIAAGSSPDSLGTHWARAILRSVDRCAAIAAQGEMESPWSGARVHPEEAPRAIYSLLLSHVHMLANRLGYSPYDELRWSRYLADAL